MLFPWDLCMVAFTPTISSLLVTQFICLHPNRQHLYSWNNGEALPPVWPGAKNLLLLCHVQITRGMNQTKMIRGKQHRVCTESYTLMVFSFSLQVIFRALSPPYDMENPYGAKVQEQLKITNLRVQLLKQQSCPCQRNDLNAKPRHFTHYAIYDFIVKGSCFCNGHADQCIPVDGFRPVKGPGTFHVVCKTSSHQWKPNHITSSFGHR